MPNPTDADRLDSKLLNANVVNIDDYRSSPPERKSSMAYASPALNQGAYLVFALLLIVLFLRLLGR